MSRGFSCSRKQHPDGVNAEIIEFVGRDVKEKLSGRTPLQLPFSDPLRPTIGSKFWRLVRSWSWFWRTVVSTAAQGPAITGAI